MKLYPEYIPAMKRLLKYYRASLRWLNGGGVGPQPLLKAEGDEYYHSGCPLCAVDYKVGKVQEARKQGLRVACNTCPWRLLEGLECTSYAEEHGFAATQVYSTEVGRLRKSPTEKWATLRIKQLTSWLKVYKEADK
jgi:hypothetical protein